MAIMHAMYGTLTFISKHEKQKCKDLGAVDRKKGQILNSVCRYD